MLRLFLVLAWAAMAANTPRIQVHGHRGARAMFPENTLPAFEYAIEQGVDALELDMAVTRDNVVVVSHDLVLRKPVCSGPRENVPIREVTLVELHAWDCGAIRNPGFAKQTPVPGTHMPTLDEVFELASKGVFEFNIETKMSDRRPEITPAPEEFVKLVLAQIRKHKLEKRVILQSFDFRTLAAMKRMAPEVRLSALFLEKDRDWLAVARETGAQILSPNSRLVTPGRMKAAHDAKLIVIPWTPNTPEEWDKMIAAGTDAIITDDPAALIAHLKKQGLR